VPELVEAQHNHRWATTCGDGGLGGTDLDEPTGDAGLGAGQHLRLGQNGYQALGALAHIGGETGAGGDQVLGVTELVTAGLLGTGTEHIDTQRLALRGGEVPLSVVHHEDGPHPPGDQDATEEPLRATPPEHRQQFVEPRGAAASLGLDSLH